MTSLVNELGRTSAQKAGTLISSSWERAQLRGLDPENVRIERIDVHVDDALRRTAQKVIGATAATLDDTTTWISLATIEGAVAYQWAGSNSFRRKLDRHDVGEGAIISEDHVGPSGIAIALSSRSPVVVSGDQHYYSSWRSLVCAASPILHPLTRQLLGAVNVTCLAAEQNKHLRIVLKTLATGIHQLLLTNMRSQQKGLVDIHSRVKNAFRSPVVTFDEQIVIVEKELEFLDLPASLLRKLVENSKPGAQELRLPTGHLVRILRHELDGSPYGFSLVFDGAAVSRSRTRLEDTREVPLQLSPLERAERDTIWSVLTAASGNKKIAADVLGISRGTLYDRLNRYGLVFDAAQ